MGDSDPGWYEQKLIAARLQSVILAAGMQDSDPLCQSYRSTAADSENLLQLH